MGKKSFVLHIDSLDILDELNDAQAGKLFRAIRAYHLRDAERREQDDDTGYESLMGDFVVRLAFAPFKSQFQRDEVAYNDISEKRRLAGVEGAKQKQAKQANAKSAKQKQAKQADSDSDSDSDININNSNELFVEVPEEPRHNPDDPIDYKKLIDYFNDETKGVFGKIKYPLSDKRKGHIRARIREHGKDAMAEVIKKATASSFLKGSSGKFKATFDWMILPTNFEKILSGNFDEQTNEKGKQRYVVS